MVCERGLNLGIHQDRKRLKGSRWPWGLSYPFLLVWRKRQVTVWSLDCVFWLGVCFFLVGWFFVWFVWGFEGGKGVGCWVLRSSTSPQKHMPWSCTQLDICWNWSPPSLQVLSDAPFCSQVCAGAVTFGETSRAEFTARFQPWFSVSH